MATSEYNRLYYSRNRERLKAQHNIYYREHVDDVQKCHVNYRKILVEAVFANYGTSCSLCPEHRLGALHIDHINGNGQRHRKELDIAGGVPFYHWLRKNRFPVGYRTLCANCNHKSYLASRSLLMSERAISQRLNLRKIKQTMIDVLGGSCIGCGCTDLDVLTVNHINKDGSAHRLIVSNGDTGYPFYRKILKLGDFAGLECMCFSCNDNHYFGTMIDTGPRLDHARLVQP